MTNEELSILLPLAARAIGVEKRDKFGSPLIEDSNGDLDWWRPDRSSDQCAEMNAALGHDTKWCNSVNGVYVGPVANDIVFHDRTTQDKVRAWMEASVRAAARVGEMMEQEAGK